MFDQITQFLYDGERFARDAVVVVDAIEQCGETQTFDGLPRRLAPISKFLQR